MKKIAILGAVLALSTSAIADDSAFYAKVGGFGSIGHKLCDDDKTIGGIKIDKDLNKFGKFTFGGSIGAGYKLMDNVRLELTASYFAGPEWKYEVPEVKAVAAVAAVTDASGKITTPAVDKVDAQPKSTLEVKASGPVGLANVYVDLFNFGPGSVYVNGGAGVSYVKVKVENKDDKTKDVEYDAKARFAWNVGAGVSFSVSEGVSIDAGYSFSDLGKPAKEDVKGAKDDKTKGEEFSGNNIRSHNINVGVRFSL
jgi:opacity protein-like surface antigen